MSHLSSGTGNTARVGVLGASGYTGGELLRLLASHDGFSVGLLTAERRAGQSLGAVFPHLGGAGFPDLVKIEDAAWDALDAVFCCLPHGTTQEVVSALPGPSQGSGPLGRLPSRGPGSLRGMVRPGARRRGAAGRRGLRPDRARTRRRFAAPALWRTRAATRPRRSCRWRRCSKTG